MTKRIVSFVLVATVGVIAGVIIVKKQLRDPLIEELVSKQEAILSGQGRIEENLLPASGGNVAGTTQLTALLQKQQTLETRVAVLEGQVAGFQKMVDQAKAARQAPPQEDFSKIYEIPVDHSPVRGSKDAPVTIVEFVDFQCPFCARFHPPVEEVLKAYPTQVKYIIKNFPLGFHPEARPAAKAAMAAGEQGKYWEMADALLENGRNLSQAKYDELAASMGLDIGKFKEDMKNKDAVWEEYITKDMALAGQVNVQGTPTFYINGRKTNARDFNSFKLEIEEIISGQK